MIIPTWAIKPHTKGDTFNSRKIIFPFDITNCKINMEFVIPDINQVVFKWSTEDNSFEKISSTIIIMKSRILDFNIGYYISDMEVIFQDGTVATYFKANLQINK